MGRKAKFSRGQVEELSQSLAGSVKKTVPPEPSKRLFPAETQMEAAQHCTGSHARTGSAVRDGLDLPGFG